jgi:saccharopine dehydrogenase-like NADP-dependent oxidoreductase
MSERITASGAVHWVGTGLSTGSGLAMLGGLSQALTVWGRTEDKAHACLDRQGLAGQGQARALDATAFAAAVEPGDVVISMLPATEHAALLRVCLDRGAHFACTSYVSADLTASDGPARDAGLVVLAEAGLDPGIDHVLAHALVDRARAEIGEGPASFRFTSYCGGVPAVANDFRYRFSWAPRGVLSALCSPARSIEAGQVRDVKHPWEATTRYVLDGETFEVYPNRDSTPYLSQYHLPEKWEPQTFVRGTLRLDGWLDAWAGVFDVLRTGDTARIDALAQELLRRYPMGPQDRDRVVLAVELRVRRADGAGWGGGYLLDIVGDETQTAMARSVSIPLAYGVAGILDGSTPAGLHLALPDPAGASAFIAFLDEHGVPCVPTL